MRIIDIKEYADLKNIFKNLKVDPYGIKIMLPKAFFRLVYIDKLDSISANILKQQSLSLGADVAISRGTITGEDKTTGCLLFANLSQYKKLIEKLKRQPFGLDKFAKELFLSLNNYQKESFVIKLNRHTLRINKRALIMGIVNLTPDSFSGDGLYKNSKFETRNSKLKDEIPKIIEYVEKMVEDGADIIDLGGQSSRPSARPVPVEEELRRTIPVIKKLAKKIKVPLSIDTYRPQVALQALDNGVSIINDITGLRNPQMLNVLKKYKAGIVIMHMKGMPATMQINPQYESLLDEIILFLGRAIKKAKDQGIEEERIIIDPGIGFGKALKHNLLLLKALREFKILGRPILVGPSRKSFIGKLLNLEPPERLFGTLASVCLAVINGARIVRVHDVKETKQAIAVLDKILRISYS